MYREKIVGAIDSAMNYLKDSIQALGEKGSNEKEGMDLLWFASSEIEYALFLFSMLSPSQPEHFSRKRAKQPKQLVETIPFIVSAQQLLKKAKGHLEAGEVNVACEEAWTAKDLVLKVQNSFETKRKGQRAV